MNPMHQNLKDENSYIIQRLRQLGEATQRDPQKAARTRAAFLEQASRLANDRQKDTPVSAVPPIRHTDSTEPNSRPFWQRSPFRRKEMSLMWTFLTTVIVTLALALGGTGITAYAAQESLPNQALYGVKTFTEDVQLQLTTQAENQLALTLNFANRRVNELATMAKQGESAIESVANRYGTEIDHALQLTAGLPESNMTSALEQVKTQLQQQEQVMAQLCQEHPQDSVLQQMQTRLQQRLHLAESGLNDPQGFQEQLRQQLQDQTQHKNQNQIQQQNETQQQIQNQTQPQNQQQNQNQTKQQQNQNQNQTQQQNQNQTQTQQQTQQQTPSGTGSGQLQPTPIPNSPTAQPSIGTGSINPGSGSGTGSGSGSGSGNGSGSGSGSGSDGGSGTGGGSGSGSGTGGGSGSGNGSGSGSGSGSGNGRP
jgi:hypothetical protein